MLICVSDILCDYMHVCLSTMVLAGKAHISVPSARLRYCMTLCALFYGCVCMSLVVVTAQFVYVSVIPWDSPLIRMYT